MSRNTTLPADRVICLLLIFLAVFRLPSDSQRVAYQVVAEIGSVFALSFLLWDKNKWLSAFAVMTAIFTFYPVYGKASFLASHSIMYGLIWYLAVYQVRNRDIILNGICFISLINCIFLVLQFYNIDPISNPITGTHDICTGLMANPNEVSALLAFSFPAFMRPKWFIGLPVICLGLMLASSFGGVLAVAISLLYIFRHRWQVVLGILAATVVYLAIDTPGVDARLSAWMKAGEMFLDHPYGAGVGHWKYVFKDIALPGLGEARMLTAHNEFVQVIFEYGIFVVPVIIGFFISTWDKATDIYKLAFIAIIVNSLVNFPFHIATTAYIGVTWLALIDKEATT